MVDISRGKNERGKKKQISKSTSKETAILEKRGVDDVDLELTFNGI